MVAVQILGPEEYNADLFVSVVFLYLLLVNTLIMLKLLVSMHYTNFDRSLKVQVEAGYRPAKASHVFFFSSNRKRMLGIKKKKKKGPPCKLYP